MIRSVEVRSSRQSAGTLRRRHAVITFLLAAVASAFAGTGPSIAGTLDEIKKRGAVTCGVSEGIPGFSAQAEGGAWSGLDIDFCKALAAAVLGDGSKVKLVPTSSQDRFKQLTAGTVDVLTRNTSWTMQREIEGGMTFPGVLFFDGQGFMVPKELGLTSPGQLGGARICVLGDTTSDAHAASYFANAGLEVELVKFAHRAEAIAAYEAGSCEARTGDRSALFGEMQQLKDPSRHMVLADTISKELLGPVARSGDHDWALVIRWVLYALVNAEELQLTQADLSSESPKELSADQKRFLDSSGALGVKFGLPSTWTRNVIKWAGSYGELFDRNVGSKSPIGMVRGANALWKDGGLMYAPPMP